MDEKEYLVEKLNSIRNEMSHLWGAAFLMGGGAITLFTTGYSNEKLIFIISGVFFSLIFANAYMIRRDEVKDILKILRKGD